MSSSPVTETLPLEGESVLIYTRGEQCDQCPSQAYYVAVFESGSLFFCKHHFNKNEDALVELAMEIIDESAFLT